MTPQEFIRRRERIQYVHHGRGKSWRKRAMRRLLAEANAMPVTRSGKLIGHVLLNCRGHKQVCVKHRYRSQQEADTALAQIAREVNGRQKPVRSYFCPACSGWHITRQAAKTNNNLTTN